MRKLLFAFMAATVLLLGQVAVQAQATTGSLKASVTDSNGAAVPSANIKVRNDATGAEFNGVTNSDGVYVIPVMLPGTYTITTEAKGFKRSVKTGTMVSVGIVNPVSVTLEAGNISETVTVTGGSEETLQTAQSQISSTIDARRVEELPSNGAAGGLDTLALLVPGVVANRVGGTNTNGAGLSVNGNRGRSNNFQIDGADNNDLTVGGPALFVNAPDSIEEVQIITNNYDARFGRNQGAIVNYVSKSGKNDFHGSLFWHHQDGAVLNSLDNLQRRSGITRNDPNLYNVFGGSVGGPVYLPGFGDSGGPMIWKGTDRAFFFFSYQGVRNPSQFTSRSTSLGILNTEFAKLLALANNPVTQLITTSSPWAIPGARLNATSTLTPVISSQFNLTTVGCARAIATTATPAAGCVYFTPINPVTGQPFLTGGPYDVLNFGTAGAPILFQAAQYERTRSTAYNEDYYVVKFDVLATKNDTVSFSYKDQKSASQNGVGSIASGITGNVPVGSQNYGGNWTRTISNALVNDFRANYQKIGVEFGGGCDESLVSCIPGPANIGNALANVGFSFAGVTKTTGMPTIGPATNIPQGRIGKVYQFADSLTWVTGKHQMTFGYEYKHLNTVVPFLPTYNGAYTFSSAVRVQNNAPSAVSLAIGNPTLAFKENDHYAFFQDDFKIMSNLTLNLGVRYENTGQPINQLNEQGLIRESNPATALFNPAIPIAQRVVPTVPTDKNNFAPRLGFAYTPNFWKGLFGENATVFRGGFSMAYEPAFYNILANVMTAAPFAATLVIPAANLPSVGSPAPLPANPTGVNVRSAASASGVLPQGVLNPKFLAQTKVGSDFRAPYSEQWSFGMQRQIGRNNIAEIRYVGNHGVGLFQNINDNFFIAPLVNGFTLSGITFPSFSSLLPPGTTAQVCTDVVGTLDNEGACNGRQFAQAGVTTRKNTGQSIYHSMQTRYNGRFLSNSLSVGATYTWSKTIDNASEIFAFGDIASPNAQNPFCIGSCERALSNLDRRHAFSANFIYDLPLFKDQRGIVGHLLGGWQFNGTQILTSGTRYTPSNGVIPGSYGLGNTYLTAGDRPFIGNPNVDRRLVGISQIDAAFIFGAPCASCNTNTGFYSMNQFNATGTWVAVTPNDVALIINGPGAAKVFGTPFGNMPRNYYVAPIINQTNLSIFKNIKVLENLKVQLRGEAFNVFNHPAIGIGASQNGFLPSISTTTAGTPGGAFAEFNDIQLSNRVIQFGLRILF